MLASRDDLYEVRMPAKNKTLSWKFYFVNIVALGALLGLAEALLGRFIRSAGLPRSPFVAGAGFAIMAVGLAVFKQARVIPGITLAGILSKWLAVPLLGLPILCQANDHLAILLNGVILYAVVVAFKKRVASGWKARGVVAGAAAFASGSAFFALGRFLVPCAHLLSFRHAGGAAFYLLTRVVPAALLAAALFPLGYALGRKLETRILSLWLRKKWLVYPAAAACALACWGVTVALTNAGF